MLVNGEQEWKYFVGKSQPDSLWNTLEFGDSLWLTGTGGIGYGNNDDNTIADTCSSIFLRKKFTIADKLKIEQLLIQAHYDDGFIVYLNGFEVARKNIGTSWQPSAFDDTTYYATISNLSLGKPPEDIFVDEAQLKYAIHDGENALAIQVNNTANDTTGLTALFYLHAALSDSLHTYQPTPPWFADPPLFSKNSELPIIYVNTWGKKIENEDKISAQMRIIYNGANILNNFSDSANHYYGTIGIENRGQSSLEFPKHSYSIETRNTVGENLNISLLGFPAENDWVLYAPYSDKSLLRNVITYDIWYKMGYYAPRTKFCEFILNDNYMGVYVFTEKIKRDRNRVDIARLDQDDIASTELTGGYIIKCDKGSEVGSNAWKSINDGYMNYIDLTFQYVYPKAEDINDIQKEYIQTFISNLETELLKENSNNMELLFEQYIDKQSAIDKIIINEISKDVDKYRYSEYMYKENIANGGLLHFGPTWDFDLGYGNADYKDGIWEASGWLYEGGTNRIFWFERMMEDYTFTCELKDRWYSLRETVLHTDTLFNYIDAIVGKINNAQVRNHYKWKTLGRYVWPNYFVADTYEEEIAFLKNWIYERIAWMDDQLAEPCVQAAIASNTKKTSCYPNPFSAQTSMYFHCADLDPYFIKVRTQEGALIYQSKMRPKHTGLNHIEWKPTNRVPAGIYIVQVYSEKTIIASEKVVKL